MATRSRARHFHATARALSSAAAGRGGADGLADAHDGADAAAPSTADVTAIIAAANAGAAGLGPTLEAPVAELARPESAVGGRELQVLHEEFRWAESKLMQAAERLAEAQETGRKDLVALAIMRRELRGSFATERAWVARSTSYFDDVFGQLAERERELDAVVAGGVRTGSVIGELAAVRAERKIFALAQLQAAAQIARIEESETTMEFQVASEAYDDEPDGASMRALARLRTGSSRCRRNASQAREAATRALEGLGIVTEVGEVSAASAFLAGEHEGDERAAQRMHRIRTAQAARELGLLPEAEAAWRSGLKHPMTFMRARRTTSAR